MSLSRWMVLIGSVVMLGCFQVAQCNALFLKGYAMGERTEHLHAQQTSLAWLNAHVTGLASPVQLAQAAQERHLTLIAWSTLSQGRTPHE